MGVWTHDTQIYPAAPAVPTWAIPVPAVNSETLAVAGDPGPGKRRGIVIYWHGSQPSNQQTRPPTVPSGGIAVGNFAAEVAANGSGGTDGWATVYPTTPWDYSVLGQSDHFSCANQVANDGQNGLTWLATHCLYADAVMKACRELFEVENPPFVTMGFSFGAWMAAVVAAARPASLLPTNPGNIIGFIAHCLPTLWNYVGLFPNPYTGLDTSGIDLGPNFLASYPNPSIIGMAATDVTVGWGDPGFGDCSVQLTAGGTFGPGLSLIVAGTQAQYQIYVGQSVTGPGISGLAQVTSISVIGGNTYIGINAGGTLTAGTYTFGYATGTPTVEGGQQSPISSADQIVLNAMGGLCTRYWLEDQAPYGNGHLFFPGSAQAYSNWIQSTFNPTYAASF